MWSTVGLRSGLHGQRSPCLGHSVARGALNCKRIFSSPGQPYDVPWKRPQALPIFALGQQREIIQPWPPPDLRYHGEAVAAISSRGKAVQKMPASSSDANRGSGDVSTLGIERAAILTTTTLERRDSCS